MTDSSSVLFDVPGPKARRRAQVLTVVGGLVILALVALAVMRLAERGQFDAELWSPWINPTDENFAQVWRLVGEGLLATVIAAALAIALSLVVGIAVGVTRMMFTPILRIPVVAFIELFRGLPVVITIVYVWRAIVETEVPIDWLPGDDALWYLVIGLTLYNSVIIAEILRAGVASLPRGQREAGLAIGMTPWQTMRSIQLPQAFRTMLPALVSQLVVILKDTSLVAVIGLGYRELLDRGNQIAQFLDNPIQSLFIVGAIYVVINYTLSRIAIWLERRLSRASSSADEPEAEPAAAGA
ncbi:amino acid ABC transporter permease [Nocardioides bruguierae]|uniref:Amino acid ABC transporter permease n=1 Tax=Nocardioides bruguierae TaxID=2945102 RepID=A0A9X2D7E5_9ACTN|nr:amino acid ABC transporter permease [Nocardioides bruguierae]MCM0620192.1 amino acid ABC transporter permease [Nocardioides bruguierae]